MTILSLDVSFSNFGWSIFRDGVPFSSGVITTDALKNKKIRVACQDYDRSQQALEELVTIAKNFKAQGFVGELPTGSQSAGAAKCNGMAIGVVAAAAHVLNLPAEWATPDMVKVAVCRNKKASKEEIMDAIIERFGGKKTVKVIPVSKGKRAGKVSRRIDYLFCGRVIPAGEFEHIADSCGAYLALSNFNLVRMFG